MGMKIYQSSDFTYSATRIRSSVETTLRSRISLKIYQLRKMQFILIIFMGIASLSFSQQTCSSCAPLVYRWTLDFSRSCPPPVVKIGSNTGIERALCSVTAIDSGVTDLKPFAVYSFNLFELGEGATNVVKVGQSPPGTFLLNGEQIEFISALLSSPDLSLFGFQAIVYAVNSNNEDLLLEWVVEYSGLCDTPPFIKGNSFGWMVFDDLDPALNSTCSSAQVTSMPSIAPAFSMDYSMSTNLRRELSDGYAFYDAMDSIFDNDFGSTQNAESTENIISSLPLKGTPSSMIRKRKLLHVDP